MMTSLMDCLAAQAALAWLQLRIAGITKGLAATVFLVAASLVLAPAVHAQVLDDLEVFRSGNDAVVRISFGARVQYLRHVALGNDRVEIFFQLITGPSESTVQERRSIPTSRTFPGVNVTLPIQPNARQQRLIVQFTSAVHTRVRPLGNQVIEVVIPGVGRDVTPLSASSAVATAKPAPAPAPAPASAPAPAPAATPVAVVGEYVIELAAFPTPDMSRAAPVPSAFQDYTVFTAQSRVDGRTQYQMLLGYFPDAAAAEDARKRLAARFPNARVIDLAVRREQTLRAAKPAAPVAGVTAPSMPATTPPVTASAPRASTVDPAADPKVEERAAELMAKGRAALDAKNNELAIDMFNQLLVLPPNRQSRPAQEMIGVARERSGERAKAKAEYELYVRLFPDGEDAERVRKRLAALDTTGGVPERRAVRFDQQQPIRSVSGSWSQFYYGGKSREETAFNTPTTVDRSSFSNVDQRSLVTNADLNARFRNENSDQRFVFRDTYSYSFLDRRPSFNRLNAAYWDYKGISNSLSSRLGRQTGLSGGVPGRFDGGVAGFAVTPKWKINAVGGVPVEYPQIDSKRVFYGLNMDLDNIGEYWHGNLFAVNQTVDGILDRRAVGSELRYLQDGRSLFSIVDYDLSYATLNTAMVQASLQTAGQSTFNILYDRRRAPTLTTTNAIFGQGTTSIKTLLQTMTEEQIRRQAADVTAIATQASMGFTTQVTSRWQIGADARLTNVGPLPATVVNNIPVPATPATGNIWTYSLQSISTNLVATRDTHVLTGTVLRAPTYNGWLAAYNNLSFVTDNLTFEPSVKYYSQSNFTNTELRRVTPGLRMVYRVHRMVSLEADGIWERSTTKSTTGESTSTRTFFSVGYRVDF
jgi:tetratricopeptide (TPR) repeat protein